MCERITHRGPDDEGVHIDGPLGLGMRRLSIIDLETGSQPIFNEDGSICVVLNGEIYNFRQLRDELRARDHKFSSNADTEVLVHLYEEFGDEFVKRLNGMFAFALWDSNHQRLIVARDRLGKKPLYYSWTDDGLAFGSELKSLRELPGLTAQLDPKAIYHYFTLGYIPNPLSIYSNVRQLPPGHCLIAEADNLRCERYWNLQSHIDGKQSKRETGERLRELLEDSIRVRMISDVPLGAFLSGGLDSSIVVALMAQQSSSAVKTFHIDFDDPNFSERRYARAVANRYGTDHHELVVRPSAIDVLDDLVDHFDEPFGDSSAIPTYFVSRITRQHVTVALAGDGGDETFAGYTRYQDILARRQLPQFARQSAGVLGRGVRSMLPRSAPGRRWLRSLGLSHDEYFAVGTDELETRDLLSRDFLNTIADCSTFSHLRPHVDRATRDDPLARYTSLDLHHYLPDDILTKVDRMSMAHSLELRAPLLDYRIVELAASLPHDWKTSNGETKLPLKQVFAKDLPPEVLEQRKRGFSVPMAKWLRTELRPVLEDALHDRDIEATGMFRMSELRALAHEHFSGRRDRRRLLWSYLFFTRWWHKNVATACPN